MVLKSGQGDMSQRKMGLRKAQKDAIFLVLKMEEVTTRNGICFWKLEWARRRVLSWSLQKGIQPC